MISRNLHGIIEMLGAPAVYLPFLSHLLVIAPTRHVFIVDVRNLTQPEEQRESTLKNQTRCVRCYPEGHGFALSSI
jgi:hypothetical protein